jgi:hypothetical protein
VDYHCYKGPAIPFIVSTADLSTDTGSYFWYCSGGDGSLGWQDSLSITWTNSYTGVTQTRTIQKAMLTAWLGGSNSVAAVTDAIARFGANGTTNAQLWGMPKSDTRDDTANATQVQAFADRWVYTNSVGTATAYTDLRASVRYNQVRQTSSHNTFDSTSSFNHALNSRIRSVEIDIHTGGSGPKVWPVYHLNTVLGSEPLRKWQQGIGCLP